MAITLKASTLHSMQKLSVGAGTEAYMKLKKKVSDNGILERSYLYYVVISFFTFGGFLLCLYFLYVETRLLPLVGWSMLFAFFNVQMGGLLHDAGHRAIFSSTKFNDLFGYICSAFIGKRYTNWRTNHNRHHAHPNQDEGDPDIEIPFSFTDEQYKRRRGIIRLIRKYQAYLYFPLGSLVAFRMRMNDFVSFKKHSGKSIIPEIVLFCLGFFFFVILPFFLFDPLKATLIIVTFHLAEGLYLLNVFAPNHKGMPELEKGVKLSFFEHQVITSRNIRGNWLTDFVYMGLNYQIEHHLFPSTPRNKLSQISPFLKEICKKMNLEFTVVGVLEQNKIILSELQQIRRENIH
ncbi:MAG: acyl-CoA desaturase [bacterium]|nr:acyl-CoA desaturase [bacterium]